MVWKILIICLYSVASFANSSFINELESAYEEFDVSMNVVWDQKDVDYANLAKARFTDRINQLVEKGMNSQDLLEFYTSRSHDQKAIAQISDHINKIGHQNLNASESFDILQRMSGALNVNGANWTGRPLLDVAIVVTTVVVVLAIARKINEDDSSEESDVPDVTFVCREWDIDRYECRALHE